MEMKFLGFAALFACGAMFSACSDEETIDSGSGDSPGGEGGAGAVSTYVLAGTVTSSSSGQQAAYVVESESLDEGNVSVLGNGYETDYNRATTWVFFGNKYLYRLAYNMGQAGTTAAFRLNANGKVEERGGEYNILNYTAYGIYGNKIITTATAATNQKDDAGNPAYGINFCYLDVEEETTDTKTILAENFLGNGEYVMLAGLLEANGKIYAGVVPMGCSPYGVAHGAVKPGNEDLVKTASGGTGGGQYEANSLVGTQYPDSCYVAIFDDDTFTNPTIVKTNQMSWAAGRMRAAYYQTVWAADNGDVYVFSPSYAKTESDPRQQTTHPSSVMRIKAGATEFDNNYGAVDLEAAALADGGQASNAPAKARPEGGSGGQGGGTTASGNPAVYRCWHITGDYFLLQMYANGINIQGSGATKMAVFKGEEKTFKFVTGLPDENVIESFPVKNIYSENGVCYISVVTNDGNNPRIYKIDPTTATATPGLTVDINEPGAIGKLVSQ